MNALGVPVLDSNGKAVAALSLAAIADRVSEPRVNELRHLLSHEARELGRVMGLSAAAAERPRAKRGLH